jgi:ABC-type antimicrobial peptide transport system permease subunit
MTRSLITLRSLAHYWRWHAGLFLGVALAAAIIGGSLVTGDSVRATLAGQADLRLGKIATAAAAADGFFTEGLVYAVNENLETSVTVEPALYLQGSLTLSDSGNRTGGVNLYGVRSQFFDFSSAPPAQRAAPRPPGPFTAAAGGYSGLYINKALAAALGATTGSELILRFEKPGFISRDAPLSGESDQTITARIAVKRVVEDMEMGTFSLGAGQAPPFNAWIGLPILQELTGLPGRANLMLSNSGDHAGLEKAIDKTLTIEDAGLTLSGEGDRRVLATSRIFLADDLAAKVQATFPKAAGVLTYLVNEIHANGKITPYSFATAASSAAPPAGAESPGNSVRVSQWLADDLALKTGDALTLKFFRVTRARNLEEATAQLKVGRILPMNDPTVRRDWTPDFPGVTESENCRDWKPGIPINQEIIRDKDDAYWKEFKGTPKLWLDLALGQELWANRFGSLTSFQIPLEGVTGEMKRKLATALTPVEAGITVVNVKDAAGRAVSESMDFGALFAAMSSFLILTALLLAALLFVFSLEQRARQCGVLRAMGWTGPEVRRLFLSEGLCVAIPAAAAGAMGAQFYARWTLGKLESDWADAALGLRFITVVQPLTLVIAASATVLLAFGVIWWASRRLLRANPKDLLSGQIKPVALQTGAARRSRWKRFVPIGTAAVLAAAMLVFTPRVPQHIAPMIFFGAAFLLLVDGLRLLSWRLQKMDAPASQGTLHGLWQLGIRSTIRRRGRSIALTGLLALGVFMITALNAFRQDARLTENRRGTGTGGFAFVGESTLPVYEDLNSNAGQKAWDFDPDELAGVRFVPFRVRDGEEASCLNLNRAQAPRVLGLSTSAMPGDAFPFASSMKSKGWEPWELLDRPAPPGGPVPAIMDQYSAMFALGKKQGDVITVTDGKGNPVQLELVGLLAGTVLQGQVIISEENFVQLYPDTKGFRFFLVDAPAQNAEAFRKLATGQLASRDLTLTPAPQRLAQFQAVQNTYLTIFTTLGGLALLLSSAGLAVLVARNVLERRAEFATLTACGFLRRQLRLLVVSEHWFLFVSAVVLGSVSAALAVWPNLRLAGAGGIPTGTLALILTTLLAGSLAFCWLAARLAITPRLTGALRHE